MTTDESPLIRMLGIARMFFTDEVETHALADMHLEIRVASSSQSPARPAVARQRCSPFSGGSIVRAVANTGWTVQR